MKRLRISHTTGYRYESDVSASYNEARMLPVSDDRQFVLVSNIEVDPVTSSHHYTDYWGTSVHAFDVLAPHRHLTMTATSLVEVRDTVEVEHPTDWDELAVMIARSSSCTEQLRQTALTSPPAAVVEQARDAARGKNPGEAALAVVRVLSEQITYESGVTGVRTTAAQAWQARTGVCQDIAHIVVGALRSVSIPARYVSGYLHPHKDPVVGETVAGESHAWVEWFCGGWRGYDPTNQIDIGERHVRVGHGRDYSDVPPLRGVYAGVAGSELFVSVSITRES